MDRTSCAYAEGRVLSWLPSHVCVLFAFPGVGETKHRSLSQGAAPSSLRRCIFTTKLLLRYARIIPSAASLSLTQPHAHLTHSHSTEPHSYRRGYELIIRRVVCSVFTSPLSNGSAHLEPPASRCPEKKMLVNRSKKVYCLLHTDKAQCFYMK